MAHKGNYGGRKPSKDEKEKAEKMHVAKGRRGISKRKKVMTSDGMMYA